MDTALTLEDESADRGGDQRCSSQCPNPQYHLQISLNSRFESWYLGLDANPEPDQHDLVTTVLHELCHGLGLVSSIRHRDGTGEAQLGLTNRPDPLVFDRHALTDVVAVGLVAVRRLGCCEHHRR